MTETHSPAERALLLVSASSEEQAEPASEPASAEAEFFLSRPPPSLTGTWEGGDEDGESRSRTP